MIALEKILNDFSSIIDENNIHITNFPCLAFLCGGSSEDTDNIRSKTFAYIKKNDAVLYDKIKLAESFIEWTDPDFYTNLVDLEDHLAHIVSFVPIILESFGSVTELGAFINNEHISNKLKVYIKREHANANSYIALGPVKKLKEKDEARVFTYEDGTEDALCEIIYGDIKEKTKPKHQTERFKPDNPAHQILLICELVNLLSLARLSEIAYLLKKFGVQITSMKIKHYLKLCEKLEILDFKNFGAGSDNTFYMANYNNLNFTIFSYQSGIKRKQKDLLRWKSIFRNEIVNKDRYRRALFSSIEKESI